MSLNHLNPRQGPSVPIDRYSYRIVEVCAVIHGSCCGTGDALPTEQLRRFVVWLEDRIERNWMPSQVAWRKYEEAIRALGMETLAEARLELEASR